MRIKKGDLVKVIAGKDKGKQGNIIEVDRKSNRVKVEGINIQTKHIKPNNVNPDGGITKIEGPIHVSNVMFIDEETNNATRIGYKVEEVTDKDTGKTKRKVQRVAKKTGSIIKEN